MNRSLLLLLSGLAMLAGIGGHYYGVFAPRADHEFSAGFLIDLFRNEPEEAASAWVGARFKIRGVLSGAPSGRVVALWTGGGSKTSLVCDIRDSQRWKLDRIRAGSEVIVNGCLASFNANWKGEKFKVMTDLGVVELLLTDCYIWGI